MFLKALTLKGFKSFAETTTLDLERGLTVVVGPNGSGKSNVVDAVAWVLGAQGPRTVRSSKMDDVIFAGSALRPALGRAEVSLVIDDTSGRLAIGLAEITITRTLFRSGESEYALNGAPCRLLDVQELLSDSGVGRQQHVIVGQGQLDTVLNARPEDRRLLIEEAAGVLKYRRRRERAERRLESTETNLLRLQDLLRELRRQLRPLERQAEAARAHGRLVDELGAVRLHLAARQLRELETRREAGQRRQESLASEEGAVLDTLSGMDAAVAAAEQDLTRLRGAGEEADLGRLTALRERALGLSAVLRERRRSLEAALRAAADESVVASLDAEAAGLRSQLEAVTVETEEVVAGDVEVAAAEVSLAAERSSAEAAWTELSRPDPEEAEARATLSALHHGARRDRAEVARLDASVADLERRAAGLAAEHRGELGVVAAAGETCRVAAGALQAAATAREGAEVALEEIERALRDAEHHRHAAVARAEALAQSVEEGRARAGTDRLHGCQGLLGTLGELVEVDRGFESAFVAAAGESLAAVLVEGAEPARQALARLRSGDGTGAVLAVDRAFIAPDRARNGTDPVTPGSGTAPEAGAGIRTRVSSRHPGVERVLDSLLAGVVVVEDGWERALDLHLENPGSVVVTTGGDRFSRRGWCNAAGSPLASAAVLEDAWRRAEEAGAAADASAGTARAHRQRLDRLREDEVVARANLEASRQDAAASQAVAERLLAAHMEATAQIGAVRSQRGAVADRLAQDEAAAAEVQQILPGLDVLEAAEHRARGAREARARLDERAAAVAALRRDHEVRLAGLRERALVLGGRLAEVEKRLDDRRSEQAEAAERRTRLEVAALAVTRLDALVEDRIVAVEREVSRATERRSSQSQAIRARADDLRRLRQERTEAERTLVALRERVQRARLEEAEVRVRHEAAVDHVRRELDCEPEEALGAPAPEMAPGISAAGRVQELERELRLLGPVNPLALEELTALSERHELLESQLEDVRQARRELTRVIQAVDAEIVDVFAAAFEEVSRHFAALFTTLFPGGTGRLHLSDPADLLETGVDIEARPAGRNLKRLSLLSGGERSLVALAFLFAVFRSRPSPFYLMDEVEAALDDVNLCRFLDLLDEFRGDSQLIVVSHQKRTMEVADCLYGVTLAPGGSSKVVSERMRSAPAQAS